MFSLPIGIFTVILALRFFEQGGDSTGRIANVVMMGALSRIAPFTATPEAVWLRALKEVAPGPAWGGNYQAFLAGRDLL